MNCIVCKNYINEKDFTEECYSNITKIKYKLYKCNKCGIGFFEPRKLDSFLYEEEAFDAYILFHLGLRDLYSHNKMFFKYFPITSKKLKLLDVGCAEGIFIKEVNKRFSNIETYGIDFDKKSIEIAKKKFGLKNLYSYSLEQFYQYSIEKNLKFDIITFFEVLEHQSDPNNFLNICSKLLNENGYIAGSVPNSKSVFRGLGGYPPHHFLWFDKKSLYNVLELNGFADIKIFFVERDLKELASTAQAVSTGILGLKLRNFIIRNLFKHESKIPLNKYRYDYIFQDSNLNKKIFKFIKTIRDITFIPLAIILKPFLRNGLYFHCKKNELNRYNYSNKK
mgnify:CR=1 FL=1